MCLCAAYSGGNGGVSVEEGRRQCHYVRAGLGQSQRSPGRSHGSRLESPDTVQPREAAAAPLTAAGLSVALAQ